MAVGDYILHKQNASNLWDEELLVPQTAFNKAFGTIAGTVCQGNDSRLSDARSASDVYAWAKAVSKPSYTNTEVGAAAAIHTHDSITGPDTRAFNYNPEVYLSGGSRYKGIASFQVEFKTISVIGVGSIIAGDYCILETHVPWSDGSGGYPIQTAYGSGGKMAIRTGTNNTTWGAWVEVGGSTGGAAIAIDDVVPVGTENLWYQPSKGTMSLKIGTAWVETSKNGMNGQNGLGWTGASYNSGTGIVTFTSNDGLGFTTGDLRGQLTDDSATYAKIGTDLKSRATNDTNSWDFSTNGILATAVSSNRTITFTNLRLNKTLKVKMVITNSATIAFPAYCNALSGWKNPSGVNGTYYMYFDCWSATGGSEQVLISSIQVA
jgi:hypothetical protein